MTATSSRTSLGNLFYQHVNPPRGSDHLVTPKRVVIKSGAPRMVCGSCEGFIMMVPVG